MEEHTLPLSETDPDVYTHEHSCGGHEDVHVHGPDCGHEAAPHGDPVAQWEDIGLKHGFSVQPNMPEMNIVDSDVIGQVSRPTSGI